MGAYLCGVNPSDRIFAREVPRFPHQPTTDGHLKCGGSQSPRAPPLLHILRAPFSPGSALPSYYFEKTRARCKEIALPPAPAATEVVTGKITAPYSPSGPRPPPHIALARPSYRDLLLFRCIWAGRAYSSCAGRPQGAGGWWRARGRRRRPRGGRPRAQMWRRHRRPPRWSARIRPPWIGHFSWAPSSWSPSRRTTPWARAASTSRAKQASFSRAQVASRGRRRVASQRGRRRGRARGGGTRAAATSCAAARACRRCARAAHNRTAPGIALCA